MCERITTFLKRVRASLKENKARLHRDSDAALLICDLVLHQPRCLKLASERVGSVLQSIVVDGIDRKQRLHGADSGVDLTARVVADVWRGADQLISGDRQVVGLIIDGLKL